MNGAIVWSLKEGEVIEGRKAVCHNCEKEITGKVYSPHWIAANLGYFYCECCFKKLYPEFPKGNVGLKKE